MTQLVTALAVLFALGALVNVFDDRPTRSESTKILYGSGQPNWRAWLAAGAIGVAVLVIWSSLK